MTLLPSSITDADGEMGFDFDDAGAGVSKKPQHSNFQAAPKNCGFTTLGKGSKKNCEKAVRLTAWVDPPPLPRSGQENVKISRQVILSFYKGQHFHK